jgi:non-homologous end joining protein Ku
VQPEQVFEFLGIQGIDDIDDEAIDTLRGVVTAIKEGSTLDEFFRPVASSKAESVKAKIEARKGKAIKEAPKETPADKPNDGKLFTDPADQKLPD